MNGGPVNDDPVSGDPMAEIEGRLRAASQALLERFPDAALPRLRLPAEPAPAPVTITVGRRAWRRGRPWLIPLAAAAAVLAAVTLPSAVSRGLGGHSQASAAAAGPEGTPPYYLQAGQLILRDPSKGWNAPPNHLLVRSTTTGKTLATVTLPHLYTSVTSISGAASDRTFALAALPRVSHGRLPYARIFVLHFDPNRGTATLSAPLISPVTGLCDMALSPDGLKLAVTSSRSCPIVPQPAGARARVKITIYTLSTGSNRSWQTAPADSHIVVLAGNLGWMADNRLLGFTWQVKGQSQQHVSWLNTEASGGALPLSPSFPVPGKPVQTVPTSDGSWLAFNGYVITKYVQAGSHLRTVPSHLPSAGVSSILWTNSTGSVAIVEAGGDRLGLVVLSRGHSRLLTWMWTSPLAW